MHIPRLIGIDVYIFKQTSPNYSGPMAYRVNPSAAKVTFVESQKTEKIMKIIITLSCCYSLESPHWELSDEYPFAMVFSQFQAFCHHFISTKLETSSKRVKETMLLVKTHWGLSVTDITEQCIFNTNAMLLQGWLFQGLDTVQTDLTSHYHGFHHIKVGWLGRYIKVIITWPGCCSDQLPIISSLHRG